jgi:hypothetical protein
MQSITQPKARYPMNVVLSAPALGITDGEHAAILEIRGLFAAGVFHHDYDDALDKPNGYNMNYPLDEAKCGTTGCIGGWMWLAMRRDRKTDAISPSQYVNNDRSEALQNLFYPPQEEIGEISYEEITPGAALIAIDTFLAGRLDWAAAVGAEYGEIEHA